MLPDGLREVESNCRCVALSVKGEMWVLMGLRWGWMSRNVASSGAPDRRSVEGTADYRL